MKKQRVLAVTAIVFLGASRIGYAQVAPPTPGHTVNEYRAAAQSRELEIQQEQQEKDGEAEEVKSAAPAALQSSPSTSSGSDAFADRVNDSLADFLPIFQFAIQGVTTSEDKESVTIKFNPIRTGRSAVSLEGSIVDPEVYKPLLDEVVESSRETQETALREEIGDFGDVTFTGTWGLRGGKEGNPWRDRLRLWGRDPEIYGTYIEGLARSVLNLPYDRTFEKRAAAQAPADNIVSKLQDRLDDLDSNPAPGCDPTTLEGKGVEIAGREAFDVRFGEVKELAELGCLGSFDYEAFVEAETRYAGTLEVLSAELVKMPSIDGVISLVDNQPQLTVAVAQRERDELAGPDVTSLSVKWEMGTQNLNGVFREYRQLKALNPNRSENELRVTAFDNVTNGKERYRAQDRYTLALTAKRTHGDNAEHSYEQTVTDAMTMMDSEIPRMANYSIDEVTDVTLRFQYTRLVRAGLQAAAAKTLETTNRVPQLSLSVEGDFVDDDDPMRRDRIVAKAGYTLPLPEGMSLPFTLTWANRGEFLGEQDEEFGAHVGLSYKLNRPGRDD